MVQVSERISRWQRAWEGFDPDAVAALYGEASTHASAVVARVVPEAKDGVLRGAGEVREYARRIFASLSGIRFEILAVVEAGSRSVVEYRRHSSGDAVPRLICEILEWDGDTLGAVRVFRF